MPEPLGYKTDGETVTLTMTRDDYTRLLLHLGFAAGAIERAGGGRLCGSLALANRLNAGNPNWTPYEIPTEET
jgi:hypothetical protein